MKWQFSARHLFRAMAISLVLTALSVGGAKLNLFDLEERSSELSDDVSQRLGLESYGARLGPAEAREGQNSIRVITVDDGTLATLRKQGWAGWPPGYDNLAMMVEDIAKPGRWRPRALFFDFLLTGQDLRSPQDNQKLAELIQTIGGASAALHSDYYPNGQQVWGEIEACHSDPLVKLACMVVWDGVPMIFAMAPSEANRLGSTQQSLDRVALLAPVTVDDRYYPLFGGNAERTDLYPALALYAAHCINRIHAGHDGECGIAAFDQAHSMAMALRRGEVLQSGPAPTERLAETLGSKPIATLWSSEPAREQNRLLKMVSGDQYEPCRETYLAGLGDVIALAFNRFKPKTGAVCRYTLWMPYDRLVLGLGLTDERDYPLLLNDTIVLVGGAMSTTNDTVPTPLHGRLPGVFYHAMATDNLVEFGAGYRRPEDVSRFGRADVLTIPLSFILMALVLYLALSRRSLALWHFSTLEGRMPVRWAVVWVMAQLGVVLAVAGAWIVLTKPVWVSVPVNWLGVCGIVVTALSFTAGRELVLDIEAALKRRHSKTAELLRQTREFLDRGTDEPKRQPEE